MSRTVAHQPANQHLRVAAQAFHDHCQGACDLPTLDIWIRQRGRIDTCCRWDLPLWYLATHDICGCGLCTSHFERRWENRRNRSAARLDTQQYKNHRMQPGIASE